MNYFLAQKMSEPTVMNVAKAFKGKFPFGGNLSIVASTLYILADAGTPQEAREEALEQAEAGRNY